MHNEHVLVCTAVFVALTTAACSDPAQTAGAPGAGGEPHSTEDGGAAGADATDSEGGGAGAAEDRFDIDCTSEWPQEWQDREDEALAAVNAVRAAGRECGATTYGPAPEVTLDPLLTEVCRCFALDQARAGQEALTGTEADSALAERVLSSTFTGMLAGYNGSMLGPSIADLVDDMLAVPGRCGVIVDPSVTLLGAAYVADPGSDEPDRWAGVMAIPPNDTPPDPTLPDWALEPGPGRQVEYAGVNLATAAFGENEIPGTFDVDYTYPTGDDVDYFVSKSMNVFRIPFLWERLQRELNAPLDTLELGRLVQLVTAATDAGALAVLDPHNYARYDGQLIGSAAVPNSAFADFWSRLAAEFGPNDGVAFGLMNEPSDLGDGGTEAWLESANAAIAAIRDAGAQNLILVPGAEWTSAETWTWDFYGASNASVMPGVVDPADNFVFEVHQYLDWDKSGTNWECVSESVGVYRVTAFTQWLRTNGYRGFLGEFGAAPTQTCYRAVDNLLAYLGENSDVWFGWTWWAAGPWWDDYPMSIEPIDGTEDAPMMTLLERHLTAP